MIKEKWHLNINGEKYLLEVRSDHLTNAGTIIINGTVIQEWEKSFWCGLPETFVIGDRKALLVKKPFTLNRHDLFIDGNKVRKRPAPKKK